MKSSGLLEPSYLLIGLCLNFFGQTTYLSEEAKAQNVPLPEGVTPLVGERRGVVGNLALRHLRPSMTLWRLP
jgi:hypothetical protein